MRLLALLALSLALPALSAQSLTQQAARTAIASVPSGGDIMSLHANGAISLADAFGNVSSSGKIQGPIVDATGPKFQTLWVDKDGMGHQVSTPIPSPTPRGIQKAADLHKKLVDALKALYPPVPQTS